MEVGGLSTTIRDDTVIGRSPEADLTIDGDVVSRLHVHLRVSNGQWILEDLSSNGTFVAGERIDRLLITGRVEARLGDPGTGVVLVLDTGSRDAANAAPAQLVGEIVKDVTIHPVVNQSVRVGRAADNDIVIDDLIVSRHHAVLRPLGGDRFEITDLGSHNGTYVNGEQIETAIVRDGDLVSIGHHLFTVVDGTLREYVDAGAIRFDANELGVRLDGDVTLLNDVSFSLPERSIMAVIGPSGAGKTTLLNALTGFRPANRGSVTYAGRDLYANYGDLRHRIGYVPQDDVLHPQLTPREALTYAATLRLPSDVQVEERAARVEEVLAELGLTHRADVPIGSLSGGQRKRASVGFELLTKPSLLFLDEPTSGLDPGYERTLTELLRTLADGGRTIVVVTHSVQSLDLCDYVLILAPGGEIAFFGPPDEVFAHFGSTNHAEVFTLLESGSTAEWVERFRNSEAYQRHVMGPRTASSMQAVGGTRLPPLPPARRGWWRQFSTLTQRYAAVISRDKQFLTLLALQAPLLGLLMWFALPLGALQPSSTPIRFSTAPLVLTVVFAGVTWLGLSNSIREIVKESAIRRRERATGLSNSAYVASKAVVLGAITVLQAFVLVLIALANQGSGWGPAFIAPARLEMAIAGALAGLAAMALGLLVSSLMRTADRAVAVLPILLLVQLILSGGFGGVTDDPGLREASYFASAQWGFSAGAATTDLQSLQVFNDCLFVVDRGQGVDAQDAELALLCVRMAASSDDGSLDALRSLMVGGLEMSSEEVDRILGQAAIAIGASPDPESVRDVIDQSLSYDPRQGIVDDVVEIVARTRPLRFWDQTAGDWLLNAGVLLGMAVAGILGAYGVLQRRDRLDAQG